jgi:hypothetical protein
VKASETGALGASSPEVRGNKPPTVKIDEVRSRNVKVGQLKPLNILQARYFKVGAQLTF